MYYKVNVNAGVAWLLSVVVEAFSESAAVDTAADSLKGSRFVLTREEIEKLKSPEETVEEYAEANNLVCCGSEGVYMSVDSIETLENSVLPVTWMMSGFVTVEAPTLKAAFDGVVDEVLQKLGIETYSSKEKKPHVKFISYTGKYPNLCYGVLTLDIDGERVTFGPSYENPKPQYDQFWESGGGLANDFCSCYHGPWKVDTKDLPKKFVKYADEIERVFNENVEYGCCGGCI